MKKILSIFVIVFLLLSLGNIIYNSFPSKSYYPNGQLEYTLDDVNPFFITYNLLTIIYGGSNFEFGEFKGFHTVNYYKSGMIKSKGISFLGRNLGLWEYYYENGKLAMKIEFKEREDYKYINGKRTIKQEVINKECWDKTGTKIECK